MPRVRAKFYTSYDTHNFCGECDNGHKSGWILKSKSPGRYCPRCGRPIRKNPRFNKKEVKRY